MALLQVEIVLKPLERSLERSLCYKSKIPGEGGARAGALCSIRIQSLSQLLYVRVQISSTLVESCTGNNRVTGITAVRPGTF
eukprot:SAG11_NODE_11621_length_748_cov_1.266564_1_plen_81_part_10